MIISVWANGDGINNNQDLKLFWDQQWSTGYIVLVDVIVGPHRILVWRLLKPVS